MNSFPLSPLLAISPFQSKERNHLDSDPTILYVPSPHSLPRSLCLAGLADEKGFELVDRTRVYCRLATGTLVGQSGMGSGGLCRLLCGLAVQGNGGSGWQVGDVDGGDLPSDDNAESVYAGHWFCTPMV